MSLAKESPYYTYADYLAWDENERYEIIDGEAYMMATPNRIHQEISGNFYYALRSFLEKKPCKVYPAPFSVPFSRSSPPLPHPTPTWCTGLPV
jgi:Uma2 family endonuclease